MNTIYTDKHNLSNGKILRLRIGYDDWCDTPREWDTLGTLVLPPRFAHWAASRNYGHSSGESDLIMDYTIPEGKNPLEYMRNLIGEALGLKPQDVIIYPITKYEHGRVQLLLADRRDFDYSPCGFVFTTKARIKETYEVTKISPQLLERVKMTLAEELDTLSSWINGESYYYAIEQYGLDELGEKIDFEYLNGCGGFIRDLDFCKKAAYREFEQQRKACEGLTNTPTPKGNPDCGNSAIPSRTQE